MSSVAVVQSDGGGSGLLTYDPVIEKCYNSLRYSDGDFTSAISAQNDTFLTLKNQLGQVISELSNGNVWNDIVCTELTINSNEKMNNSIDEFITILDGLNEVEPTIDLFNENAKSYLDAVDEYNGAYTKRSNLNYPNKKSDTYKDEDGEFLSSKYWNDYNEYERDYNNYTSVINNKRTVIASYHEASNNCLEKIKGLLTLNYDSSLNLASSSVNTLIVTLNDGTIKKTTKVIDSNDNIISEYYEIFSENGKVLKTGTVTYSSDGSYVDTSSYTDHDIICTDSMAYSATGVLISNKYTKKTSKYSIEGVMEYYDDGEIVKTNTSTKYEYDTNKRSESTFIYREDGTRKSQHIEVYNDVTSVKIVDSDLIYGEDGKFVGKHSNIVNEDATDLGDNIAPQDLLAKETIPESEENNVVVKEIENTDDLSENLQEIVDDEMMAQAEETAEENDGRLVEVTENKNETYSNGDTLKTETRTLAVEVGQGEGNDVNDASGENNLITKASTTKGNLTTTEGGNYDFSEKTIYTENGNIGYDEKILTNSSDGKTVYTETESCKSEGNFDAIGTHTSIKKTETNDAVVFQHTREYGDGELKLTETVTRSTTDPREGTYTDSDGFTYEFKIDENGDVIRTDVSTGFTDVVDADYRTVIIRDSAGNEVERLENLNWGSEMEFAEVKWEYQDRCGNTANDTDGLHSVITADFGDEVHVGNYTFEVCEGTKPSMNNLASATNATNVPSTPPNIVVTTAVPTSSPTDGGENQAIPTPAPNLTETSSDELVGPPLPPSEPTSNVVTRVVGSSSSAGEEGASTSTITEVPSASPSTSPTAPSSSNNSGILLYNAKKVSSSGPSTVTTFGTKNVVLIDPKNPTKTVADVIMCLNDSGRPYSEEGLADETNRIMNELARTGKTMINGVEFEARLINK